MRKAILIFCLAGSGLIILGLFNFFESLLVFLVAGVIPGTNYALPYQAMLILIITLMSLVIFRTTIGDVKSRITKNTEIRKKHLPKRRYSQI